MIAQRINLATTASFTKPIQIGKSNKLSVDINDDADTYTWGSAIVELQYSLQQGFDDDDLLLDNWVSFGAAVTFTSTNKSRRAIGVTGAGWVRLKTTTADGGADPAAVVTMILL